MCFFFNPPALRNSMIAGATLLVACTADDDGRPKPKPEQLTVRVASSDQADGGVTLNRAQISTKSGEIMMFEPDGEITSIELTSSGGGAPFTISETDLVALNSNLTLDLGEIVAVANPDRKTAQERAIEEFAARTKPALPVWQEGTEVAAEDFIAVRVDVLNERGAGDLVEVTANLRQGVDADVAYSYAVCALAGWADAEGTHYGRHIRTLQDKRHGKLMIGAAFTVSDEKPLGLRVMETEQTLLECKARGIPVA